MECKNASCPFGWRACLVGRRKRRCGLRVSQASGPTAGSEDLVASTAGLWAGLLAFTPATSGNDTPPIFSTADRFHRGYIDQKLFKIIKYASPIFTNAEFGYFDENGDGRITNAEFVDKPSEFFLRFDKRHDCRVMADEMNPASTAAQPKKGRHGGASGF